VRSKNEVYLLHVGENSSSCNHDGASYRVHRFFFVFFFLVRGSECPRCVVVMGEVWVVVGYFSCLLPWKAHVEMDGVIDSFSIIAIMGVFCFYVFRIRLVEKQNPLCTY
jgi:hypothetical protein